MEADYRVNAYNAQFLEPLWFKASTCQVLDTVVFEYFQLPTLWRLGGPRPLTWI